MKVFKFGGASVKDAAAVKNVATILNLYAGEKLLIVISAMGKTTNGLEELAHAIYHNKPEKQEIFQRIKVFHDNIINDLLAEKPTRVYDDIDNIFIELEHLSERRHHGNFDYVYDQVVSFGEIICTRIVSAYLNENGFANRWIDARNFIATDSNYREGQVQWDETYSGISKRLKNIMENQIVVTQGFIGRAPNNTTTTLGREGSDYSAAIFAYCLDAESVTIWKDVAGVMNADPKRIPDAIKIDELGYDVAIELAYYGATIIHPKTIQPLKSKSIPLYVKSFVNPKASGTVVSNAARTESSLPYFIFKGNQALVSISSRDFSFIVEDNLKNIFAHLAECRIKVNLMQNSAISFSLVVNQEMEKLQQLEEILSEDYHFSVTTGTEMITLRNYDQAAIDKVVSGKQLLMEQKTSTVLQVVVQN